MGGGLVLLIVAIVVITAIVGAIAQFLNKLNEANAPAAKNARGDAPRQTQKDMDRFLAEIDRLRKKNTENAEPTAARPKQTEPPVKPKTRPAVKPSRPERVKPLRPLAEIVEPPKRKRVELPPMEVPPTAIASPGKLDPAALPVAAIVGPATGVPVAPRMARPSSGSKARPALKGNLATLLASGNGLAMAVILQEVLGPPKCKQ